MNNKRVPNECKCKIGTDEFENCNWMYKSVTGCHAFDRQERIRKVKEEREKIMVGLLTAKQ
jgi:hypothetical protein